MANDKEIMVIGQLLVNDFFDPKLEPESDQELPENNSIESEEISETLHTTDIEIKEEFDELVANETFQTQKNDLEFVEHKIKKRAK